MNTTDKHYILLTNHLEALTELYDTEMMRRAVSPRDVLEATEEFRLLSDSIMFTKQEILRLKPQILLETHVELNIVSRKCIQKMETACLGENKLMAIRYLKDDTGWGLKDCKDIFDKWYAVKFRGLEAGKKFNF